MGFVRFAARASQQDRVPFSRQKLYKEFSESTSVPLQFFLRGGRASASYEAGARVGVFPVIEALLVEELFRAEVMINPGAAATTLAGRGGGGGGSRVCRGAGRSSKDGCRG